VVSLSADSSMASAISWSCAPRPADKAPAPHPAPNERLNGLTSGAVKRLARTETDPRPAASRPRISATAWYCWVEETCT
jgi:hypothetical protein